MACGTDLDSVCGDETTEESTTCETTTQCNECTTCCASPCCCTTNQCCDNTVPAAPTPHYACGDVCAEDHCKEVVYNQYSTTVKVCSGWVVPGCGQNAIVKLTDVTSILVGSQLWNPDYGFFTVEAFNTSTHQLTISNPCATNNAAPGTVVPACTEFIITVPPCCNTTDGCTTLAEELELINGNASYTLTVESSAEFEDGDTLQIAGRDDRFVITDIPDATTIQGTIYPTPDANETVAIGAAVCEVTCPNVYVSHSSNVYEDTVEVLNPGEFYVSAEDVIIIENTSICRSISVHLGLRYEWTSRIHGTDGQIASIRYEAYGNTSFGPIGGAPIIPNVLIASLFETVEKTTPVPIATETYYYEGIIVIPPQQEARIVVLSSIVLNNNGQAVTLTSDIRNNSSVIFGIGI